MDLCIFEDARAGDFFPLTYFRPVFDLRCGILTLREKILRHLPGFTPVLVVRPYLAPLLREENPGVHVNTTPGGPCLFLNGRVIMTKKAGTMLKRQRTDALLVAGEEIVGAWLSAATLRSSDGPFTTDGGPEFSRLGALPRLETGLTLLRYPWDILGATTAGIIEDYAFLGKGIAPGVQRHASAVLAGRSRISIGKGTVISPGAIIDAGAGPVYIGKNVRIMPGAVLEGPCAVGDGSIVRIHAKIYAGTSIGPVCKVGGEIEGSTLHSHANKQHDGFLGDSYLGMWVNLGAGTTNSNLKNTYGNIRMDLHGASVDTGRMFVGMFAGDHAKAGINSTINTGTIIGPSSNIFGGGLPPRFIPSFAWGGAAGLVTYELEKALAVAVTVMGRRSVACTPAYEALFRHVFALTAHERTDFAS
jgi:UDP-N-acetylglucosamine diphosphorylase / glucose-1-phosphate thymidylyltransferase / UDP-N-acetylgalactosamine diphosphorylase / glucosamine-1-phosphate N-acetyltransferase / galactosamine-1-phosphate N-acetyltransferase